MTSDDTINANFMEEWKKARDVLAQFDDRLKDLRKVGFSFLTALLAADAIIFKVKVDDIVLSEWVKWAVLVVNLLLIVTLLLIDSNYRVFQRATAMRAKVLERYLNLELTEVIAQRHRAENVGWFVTAMYMAFTVGVLILGLVTITNLSALSLLVIVFFIANIVILYLSSQRPRAILHYPYGMLDWTLDRLECVLGDEVRLTLTNLESDKKMPFPKDTIMWEVIKEGDEKPVKIEKIEKPLIIEKKDSYTWLWNTKDKLDNDKVGIYRVVRIIIDKETGKFKLWPLTRKLWIKAPPTTPNIDAPSNSR